MRDRARGRCGICHSIAGQKERRLRVDDGIGFGFALGTSATYTGSDALSASPSKRKSGGIERTLVVAAQVTQPRLFYWDRYTRLRFSFAPRIAC
jgi:hypothetical protein